jgi:Mlc titration factor MtfA (ptsG expression regulator)
VDAVWTTPSAWLHFCRRLPVLRCQPYEQQLRLRSLTQSFLQRKRFQGAQGLKLTPLMQRIIAAQACVPILNLGIDWLQGWVSLVIYPDEFFAPVVETDEAGVVHEYLDLRCGESWHEGPLILSWQDARQGAFDPREGNVVIHEIAHKLDALNGDENGFPPLHKGMSASRWTDDFGQAFDDLQHRLTQREIPPIDAYAGESPAEFFAVCSEFFFTQPKLLTLHYPAVYTQLALFYRQNPTLWLAPASVLH